MFTHGDPSGIGPEILLRSLKNMELRNAITPVCVGSEWILKECQEILRLDLSIKKIHTFDESIFSEQEVVYLIDPISNPSRHIIRGKPNALSGEYAIESVLAACKILQVQKNISLITAPISKKAIQLSKYHHYKGHSEILQEQFAVGKNSMKNMLVVHPFSPHPLRMVHVTSHIPLRQVSSFLLSEDGKASIAKTVQLACDGLKKLGITNPRIAVTGINPHLEEWGDKDAWGNWGMEEVNAILPTIDLLKSRGIQVFGPFTPDSAYRQARKGEFDAVVAMFHDQSHIAALADPDTFDETVIFTIGTPFFRMSTSHGTAADIADKFAANPKPFENCIRMMIHLLQGTILKVGE